MLSSEVSSSRCFQGTLGLHLQGSCRLLILMLYDMVHCCIYCDIPADCWRNWLKIDSEVIRVCTWSSGEGIGPSLCQWKLRHRRIQSEQSSLWKLQTAIRWTNFTFFLPSVFLQSICPPTNALNKIQFITFIKTPTYVSTEVPCSGIYRTKQHKHSTSV